jgi:hypothetical protein
VRAAPPGNAGTPAPPSARRSPRHARHHRQRGRSASLGAPRKQRHTARRVLTRLVDEHGAVELSYRRCATTSPSVVRRSLPRPISRWRTGACRRSTDRRPRPRLISMTCGWSCARDQDQDRAVHDAAVVFGSGRAPGIPVAGTRGVSGKPCLRVRPARRRADRPDPLRQPQAGGVAGAVRPHPGRVGPVGGVPLALRLRRVLLPPPAA